MEFTLTEQNAVPLIVLSTARDPVEQINSILRRAGHPVHCTWIPSLRDLGDALEQLNPELLLFVDGGGDDLAAPRRCATSSLLQCRSSWSAKISTRAALPWP